MAGGFPSPEGKSFDSILREFAKLQARIRDLEKPSGSAISSLPTQVAAKTTVTWSLEPPIGDGSSVGDAWYRKDSLNQIIGIWYWDGTEWISQTITDDAVSNLSADKITAGTLDASLVAIRSAATGGRVEIDGAGFRGYDGSDELMTSVGTDGKLTAQDATVLGTIRTALTGRRVEISQIDRSVNFYSDDGTKSSIVCQTFSGADSSLVFTGPVVSSNSPSKLILGSGGSVGAIDSASLYAFEQIYLTTNPGGRVYVKSNLALTGALDAVGSNVSVTAAAARSLGIVPRVASVAARTALYPFVAQGDKCFRTDVMWEETYFAAYDATTNPGGATVAGWYPVSGMVPYASRERTATAQTVPNGTNTNMILLTQPAVARGGITYNTSTGFFTVPIAGRYSVYMWGKGVFSASGRFIVQAIGTFGTTIESSMQANANTATKDLSAVVNFAAGATIRLGLRQDSGFDIDMTAGVTLTYLGPS